MRRISMTARDSLVAAIAGRYSQANKTERGRILDEFTAITGFHRKHAMRLLRSGQPDRRSGPRPGRRIYDDATREALIVIWEASDRICGKRLRPLVPIMVEAMERHGHLNLAPEVRISLLAMSAATIDRALRAVREKAGRSTCRKGVPSAAIKRTVPVRTFDGWDNPAPGFVEADLVSHSGPVAKGSFVQTLVLTDIATGWTECAPLLVREQRLLTEVLGEMRKLLLFRPARARHRQRQRVHERDCSGLLRASRDRDHPLPSLSQERPGLGGAEEGRRPSPHDRLPPLRRPRRRSSAGALVCRDAAVRELLPTLLQTGRE